MTKQIFKIEGDVAKKYLGAGYAFAAIKDSQLVHLVYFGELFDEYDHTNPTDSEVTHLIKMIEQPSRFSVSSNLANPRSGFA